MNAAQSLWPRVVSAGEALTDFIRVDTGHWHSRAGGSPWNVARILGTLGVASAFAGSVSRDALGDELIRLSRNAGLDMRFMQQHAKPPLLAMVHEIAPPRYFFVGTDSADLAFDPSQLPAGWINAIEWLHVGSISLTREPLRTKLLALVDAAQQAGKRISFDPNFRTVMDERYDTTLRYIAERADLIKVSDEDICGLFRIRDTSEGLRRLRAINPAAAILFTRGAEGAELHIGDLAYAQTSPIVDVVDTVGAGDASTAGLLYSLLMNPGANWRTHLRYAVATGAAACCQTGATPPDCEQIKKILGTMS